jgi:hypothetical protein
MATPRPQDRPNFLVIGAMRSGTSSLAYSLRSHLQVFMAPSKELHFFTDRFDEGLDWYRYQFRGSDGCAAVGEATPTYMYDPTAVQRMAALLPDARLIAVLRNPVDRAYSHYWHQVEKGRETMPFADAVAAEPARLAGRSGIDRRAFAYLDKGRYLEQLERVGNFYARDRIHVLLFEDLRDRPAETFAGVCEFLGIDPEATPAPLTKVVNPHIRVRSEWVRRVTRPLPERLRNLVGRVNAPPTDYPTMDPELRAELSRGFERGNDALATWLGRDLSAWRN